MRYPLVFRFEAECEEGIPFPSLVDAMREPPSHAEAHVSTSVDGVVLCEARVNSGRKRVATFAWQPTVAGMDVLEDGVRGLRRAS